MKKQWLWLIVVMLLVAALGCGRSTPEPTTEPTPVATDAPTREATPPPSTGGGFTLTVDNRSHYDVCYVYISASDSDSWGADWLDADVIGSNSTYTFDVPAGTYDIMLADCANMPLATDWEVSEDLTLRVGGANQVAVTVSNDADMSICYMLISPSTDTSWGEDMLGRKETIPAGRDRVFFVASGTYDIKAMDCDENVLGEQYEVALQQDTAWSPLGAGGGTPAPTGPTGNQITLTVANESSEDICFLYVSSSSATEWGADRLGTEILWADETFEVYLEPGTYDLKAEFCGDTDPLEELGVDLSSNTTWTIND